MWWITLLASLFSIVFLYFLFIFIRTVFSFIYLYIEHHLDKNIEHQYTLYQYIKVGLHEFWVLNLKLVMWVFDDKSPEPHKMSSHTAIVLVHGFLRSPGDWIWFKHQLQKKTTLPIFNIKLRPALAPMQSIAENFAADLEILEKKYGIKHWYLIAHSMGGLVCTYCAIHLDFHQKIKKVITLGSPFHGTKVSSLAMGDNAKQMHPHSQFVMQLRREISKEQHFDLYQIATPFDNIIFPWQSSFTEPQFVTAQYTTKPTGHIALLYSNETLQQVEKWLQHKDTKAH